MRGGGRLRVDGRLGCVVSRLSGIGLLGGDGGGAVSGSEEVQGGNYGRSLAGWFVHMNRVFSPSACREILIDSAGIASAWALGRICRWGY